MQEFNSEIASTLIIKELNKTRSSICSLPSKTLKYAFTLLVLKNVLNGSYGINI